MAVRTLGRTVSARLGARYYSPFAVSQRTGQDVAERIDDDATACDLDLFVGWLDSCLIAAGNVVLYLVSEELRAAGSHFALGKVHGCQCSVDVMAGQLI